MTDPSGNNITYAYDVNGNLISATYQDSTVRQYLYENSAFPNNLTGLIDESGSRFLTVAYDPTTGAVVSSQQSGGAQAVSLTYSANGAISTNALGETDTYTFTNDPNYAPRATSLSRNNFLQTFTVPAGATDPQRRLTQSVDANGNITTYAYDANHLTSRTEASGTSIARTTSYQYLSTLSALPTLIVEPLRQTSFAYYAGTNNVETKTVTDTTVGPTVSRTWTYAYNSNGQVQTIDGPRTDVADITTFAYYACMTGAQCGQIDTITNALGQVTTFNTYNANGQPLTITDPNGVVTTLTYDARQRLTSSKMATEMTTYTYWPTGLLKQVTRPDSSSLVFSYDGAHRLTNVTDGSGNTINYTLDAMGNRTAANTKDPSGVLSRTHSEVFNSLSELYQDIGAAQTNAVTTTMGYDANGNLTSTNAPLARNTNNQYDALNRLIQITDPADGITKFSFDANNQLTKVTDPRNLITSYQRDGFGEVTGLTSPDTNTTASLYDLAGNLKQTTDARGATATYGFDALNRITAAIYANGSTVDEAISYTYDAGTNGVGRPTSASDANQSMGWSYDALGRVINKTQAVARPPANVGWSYNIGYGYTNGDLTSLSFPFFGPVTYTYNSNHQIVSVQYQGTTVVSNVLYDPFGGVRGWTWGNNTTEVRLQNTDGNPSLLSGIESVSIGYDDAFRAITVTNSSSSSLSWSYGYDSMDRLTSASKSGTTLGWLYDGNGNRVQQTGPSSATPLSTAGKSFTYNSRGRMTSATVGGTVTNYVYNALGQLVFKDVGGVGTGFIYDEAGHLLAELDDEAALFQETIWLGDIPIAEVRQNAPLYYVHANQLNAPIMITRSTDNAIMWRWDTDPFGTASPNQNPQNQGTFTYNLRFPGQYYQAETGLNYNYHRDYDSAVGRYVESDPIGLKGGINTYAFVGSNPLLRLDPLGLCYDDEPNLAIDNSGGLRILAKWAANNPGQVLALAAIIPIVGEGAAVVEAAEGAGALSPAIASTFANGEYTATTLAEDMTAYRYSGGVSGAYGSFLTDAATVDQISSPVAASIALNLPVGATAETLNVFIIPAGTTIYTGGVAGGAESALQIFIQDSSVLIPK